MSTAQISIVLPCFNEGAQIDSCLTTLESWFTGLAEILVIDDGSNDDTFERAQAYAGHHAAVRVHRLAVNQGKGAAILAAIPLVRGEHVVVMDADLAYERESVHLVLDGLASADVVVGNRRHDDSRYSVPVRVFGFLYRRHLVGLAFNAIVRALLQMRLRDTQCGLKAFRREALEAIGRSSTIKGFAFDVEMLLIARALGLRLSDVPVRVTYCSGKSSVRLVRTGIAVAWDIVRIAARRAMGRYMTSRLRRDSEKTQVSV